MRISDLTRLAILKTTVFYLVDENNTAVFFNLVKNYQSKGANLPASNDNMQAEDVPKAMQSLPRIITMSVLISDDVLGNITDTISAIASVGYVADVSTVWRKEQLETWRVNRERLKLYGLNEVNEDLILTSVKEAQGGGMDHSRNRTLSLAFNEVKKSTKGQIDELGNKIVLK